MKKLVFIASILALLGAGCVDAQPKTKEVCVKSHVQTHREEAYLGGHYDYAYNFLAGKWVMNWIPEMIPAKEWQETICDEWKTENL